MSLPDLSTEEGRAAYRKELKGVAKPYRLGGFVLILLGAGYVMGARLGWWPVEQTALVVAYGMVALGWALFLTAIFLRTRYHKRRLQEGL
ncbi:hypothetical protein [Brevundimonas lenta]|uniref:Uncharacterized protein n=1 Tax=Brevundimonas lenta TaxID=424796 RepID=A0A7W6NQ27_9CAUL|nr:hypothetical protein [Brevundimonas lenta]MBB4082772.1 hypothetical protein [Brevundimonas lenta]